MIRNLLQHNKYNTSVDIIISTINDDYLLSFYKKGVKIFNEEVMKNRVRKSRQRLHSRLLNNFSSRYSCIKRSKREALEAKSCLFGG